MSMTLPSELQYSSLPSLPSGSQSYEQFSIPVNGASFKIESGNMLQFDLVSRGYLVPDSVYLSYKYAIVSTGQTKTQRLHLSNVSRPSLARQL